MWSQSSHNKIPAKQISKTKRKQHEEQNDASSRYRRWH
uniref:Uncharacterized protein n=1 Tax=Rhizophora mucronata TaxID=61149 RepID=A0A2P2N6Y8_RHIMU